MKKEYPNEKLFPIIVIAMLDLCLIFSCEKHKSEVGKIVLLKEGIFAKVSRVRTWTFYDSGFPPIEHHQYWFTSGTWKIGVRPFTGERRPTPKGRFCELIVWIENKATQQDTIPMSGINERDLDLRLLLDDSSMVSMSGYRVPGFSIADESLVGFSEGKIGIALGPNQKTWLLVVFDVPRRYRTAQFQIKNVIPIRISF